MYGIREKVPLQEKNQINMRSHTNDPIQKPRYGQLEIL